MPEETFNTIIKFMLVVAVVIVVVLVIKGPAWTLVKSVLKIGTELTETPETQEVIKKKFDSLISFYQKCLDREKTDCICEERNFDEFGFPPNYVLSYETQKISLNKVLVNKSEEEKHSQEIKNLNCIMEKDLKKYTEASLKISYEEKAIINKEYRFGDIPFAFKVNKERICFIVIKAGVLGFFSDEKEIISNLEKKEYC